MQDILNPYIPGAGVKPPELAGRDDILDEAEAAIKVCRAGGAARSVMLVGLRGVGKTVVLNEIQSMADKEGAFTDIIEVSNNEPLSVAIIATLRAALLKLDRTKGVSEQVKKGLRVLKSFVGAVKVKYADIEFSVDVEEEVGTADSGLLTRDLTELFLATGEAAKARQSSIVILIDEIQNLGTEEFEALIMAVHRINQKGLPFLVVGAGLPSLVKLSNEAKSYSERLFNYPAIENLNDEDARKALVVPANAGNVEYENDAISLILKYTKGYPYFLQEWGYQCWRIAKEPLITVNDVNIASKEAIARLDENFFKSRYSRIAESQKKYLYAMAELGPGPYSSGEIAKLMGKKLPQVSVIRNELIKNGVIYSPGHGEVAFTVPLFDEFIKRTMS